MGPPDAARKRREAMILKRSATKKKAAERAAEKRAQAAAEKAAEKRVQAERKKASRSSNRGATNQSAQMHAPELDTEENPFLNAQTATAEARAARSGKRKRTAAAADSDDEDEDVDPCLHPDDPANFLKLCKALRILTARKLNRLQIEEADKLLRSYCAELVTVSYN